jgi:hypothetical protein
VERDCLKIEPAPEPSDAAQGRYETHGHPPECDCPLCEYWLLMQAKGSEEPT